MVEDILESLVAKLHPRRWPGVSGKMMALLAYTLGVVWTEPAIAWAAVTSDGFIVTEQYFIGEIGDFERNMGQVALLGGLTDAELAEFWRRWRERVQDWRPESRGGGQGAE